MGLRLRSRRLRYKPTFGSFLERHSSTGSEFFSLLTCFDATQFVLLSVFALKGNICPKFWVIPPSKNANVYFRLIASFYNVFTLASSLICPKTDVVQIISYSTIGQKGDACEDESHQLDGRSDSENSYYGDVESLSCASVEPISVSEDDLSEMLSKGNMRKKKTSTKIRHSIDGLWVT